MIKILSLGICGKNIPWIKNEVSKILPELSDCDWHYGLIKLDRELWSDEDYKYISESQVKKRLRTYFVSKHYELSIGVTINHDIIPFGVKKKVIIPSIELIKKL